MTIPNISEEIIYFTTKDEALKYLPAPEQLTGSRRKHSWIIYWLIGTVIIAFILYTGYLSERSYFPLDSKRSSE